MRAHDDNGAGGACAGAGAGDDQQALPGLNGGIVAPATAAAPHMEAPRSIDDFVDPDVEAYRLSDAAAGNPDMLAAMQAELRREEAAGWCDVLLMTDAIAVVRWRDQFVLTLTDVTVTDLARPAGVDNP